MVDCEAAFISKLADFLFYLIVLIFLEATWKKELNRNLQFKIL